MTTSGTSFWTSGAVPLIEPEFLSSIIGAASDIALVVSSSGKILSVVVNQNSDGFGNLAHWEGRMVVDFLTDESVVKFQTTHDTYLAGNAQAKPVELNHIDNALWQYPVRYTFHRFGHEDAVLMLGRDLRPIAETQQQLVQAQIALEQGYEARREFDARFRVILANVHDAVVFVAVQSGQIEDANERAAALLGVKADALRGTSLASLFSDRSAAELTESLLNATLSDDAGPVTVRVSRTRQGLVIQPIVFRAGGQRVLMCRLTSQEDQPSASDTGQSQVSALFRHSTDAMAFLDQKGVMLSVNESFLDLIGAAHLSDVIGTSFSDCLVRGQVDMAVLLDNALRAGQVRHYATRMVNALGAKVPVEISAAAIQNDADTTLGLIIRDTSQIEPVRGSRKTAGDHALSDGASNVMELVGSASLKEIVAETTDVVEKMCIETAVELTRNNRVAAAEMLGLSRQSLYVKLRKYGLLNKGG